MMIYKFETNLSKSDNKKLLKSMSKKELKDFENIHMDVYEKKENGKTISYLIVDRPSIYKIFLFLRKRSIKFVSKNITKDVLIGKVTFKNTEFEKNVNSVIKSNLSVNFLLDKINTHGVNSLSDIDKEFLRNS